MLIGSSNEIPEEGDGLEAIFDRLAIKHHVGYIADKANRGKMMQEHARRTTYGAQNNFIKTTISLKELVFINSVMQMVTVDASVYNSLTSCLHLLDKESIHFSDRKLNWCIDIVRAQALLSGRMTAISDDIIALVYTLWENWGDVPKVREILLKSINPLRSKIESELASMKELAREAQDIVDGNFKDPSGTEVTDPAAKMSYMLERTKKAESISVKVQQSLAAASKQGTDVAQYTNELTAIKAKMQEFILQAASVGVGNPSQSSGQAF